MKDRQPPAEHPNSPTNTQLPTDPPPSYVEIQPEPVRVGKRRRLPVGPSQPLELPELPQPLQPKPFWKSKKGAFVLAIGLIVVIVTIGITIGRTHKSSTSSNPFSANPLPNNSTPISPSITVVTNFTIFTFTSTISVPSVSVSSSPPGPKFSGVLPFSLLPPITSLTNTPPANAPPLATPLPATLT